LIEVLGPSDDRGMIDHTPRIDISQTFQSELMALGFKFDPRNQRLTDDPPLGTVKPSGKHVNLFGKVEGDVGGDNTAVHISSFQIIVNQL